MGGSGRVVAQSTACRLRRSVRSDSRADNFADHAFDTVNLYLTSILSYTVGGLPGQFAPAFNWSNKPKIDLASPFGSLTTQAAATQAVGALLGASPFDGL